MRETMQLLKRPMIAALLALAAAGQACALSLPGFGKARQPAAAAAPPAAPLAPGQWPQARSDIAPDPAIRFGALPNGLRYAIRRQSAASGAVSLRLRIAAGSLVETDDESGFARLLTRLAVDGSSALPDADRAALLSRLGLAFTADANAATTFRATTLGLDLAKTEGVALDDALTLLRDAAAEPALAAPAIDKERAAVLADAKAGDTPARRLFADRLAFLLEGQRPPQRPVTGAAESLAGASPDKLAAFHARWWRPDRATLIVVGDIDPQAVEAAIRSRFGDWAASGPAPAEPDLGSVAQRAMTVRLDIEPGFPASVELAWVAPPDLSADTAARRRRELIDSLGLAVINRRLSAAAAAGDSPFLSAGAFREQALGAATVTALIASVEPGGWRAALTTLDQAERRAVAYGVRPDEIAGEIARREAALKAAAADAAGPCDELADQLAGELDWATVATSSAQDLAAFEQATNSVTAAEVSQSLKSLFHGSGPLIFVSGPDPIEEGEAAVRGAWLASVATAVDAPPLGAPAVWPYDDFGDPSKVVDQKDVADLDTVFVTFANGVRLTVKPTKFRQDEVMVRVRAGAGLAALAPDRAAPRWAAPALVAGGLGKISRADADRALAPALWSAAARFERDAVTLTGATRADDLDTQLQVLTAYLTDPGWRPRAIEQARADALAASPPPDSLDVLERGLPALTHPGDRRWATASGADIAAAGAETVKADVAAMAAGPIEVIVVGAITPDKAIDAVARTFGALPPRPSGPRAPTAPAPIAPAAGPPTILGPAGAAQNAAALIAWPADDALADPRGARAAAMLADVIARRLAVDFPGARAETGSNPGWLGIAVEARADQLEAVFAKTAAIRADLVDHAVAPDELDQVRKARLEALAKARQTNAWWLDALAGAQTDPRRLAALRAEAGAYEAMTPDTLRRVAGKYLAGDAPWKLEVRPPDP
jgi:zinc protease